MAACARAEGSRSLLKTLTSFDRDLCHLIDSKMIVYLKSRSRDPSNLIVVGVLAPFGEKSAHGKQTFVLVLWSCLKAELGMEISPVEATVSNPYISVSSATEWNF